MVCDALSPGLGSGVVRCSRARSTDEHPRDWSIAARSPHSEEFGFAFQSADVHVFSVPDGVPAGQRSSPATPEPVAVSPALSPAPPPGPEVLLMRPDSAKASPPALPPRPRVPPRPASMSAAAARCRRREYNGANSLEVGEVALLASSPSYRLARVNGGAPAPAPTWPQFTVKSSLLYNGKCTDYGHSVPRKNCTEVPY